MFILGQTVRITSLVALKKEYQMFAKTFVVANTQSPLMTFVHTSLAQLTRKKLWLASPKE
jgi:hypothetical protein